MIFSKKLRLTRKICQIVLCGMFNGIGLSLMFLNTGQAQETDIYQHANYEQAGIKKTLADQIGTGRGDIHTPNSSLYLIHRDPFRAIRRGRSLFQRKFTLSQGMGPRNGDGFGDIGLDASLGAGLADSCATCHRRPRGSAGFGGDVFTRPDSRDAPHLFGLGIIEMFADEMTGDLREIRNRAILHAQAIHGSTEVALNSKGITFGSIRVNPDGSIDPSQLEGVDEDLRVRPFFHHDGTISIREFVVGAFNAEMGLEAFDPDLAQAKAGERIITPAGMVLDGTLDRIEVPPAASESDDPDVDRLANEVPVSLIDHMEFYLLNYFTPGIGRQTHDTEKGERIFQNIRCTVCHIQHLIIEQDRRVADVDTTYNLQKGIFNQLFAVATPQFQKIPASGSPPMIQPNKQSFMVKHLYADFKRHDLGPNFWERNFDGTLTKHL